MNKFLANFFIIVLVCALGGMFYTEIKYILKGWFDYAPMLLIFIAIVANVLVSYGVIELIRFIKNNS